MCQIVNGNRRDVEDSLPTSLPPSRRLSRPKFLAMADPSMLADISLCPVMGKAAIPPDGPDKFKLEKRRLQLSLTASNPASIPASSSLDKDHSCFICSDFLESGMAAASSIPSPSSETTLATIFQVLRRSTQPAHFVVLSFVIILAVRFYPTCRQQTNLNVTRDVQSESTLWPLLYLSSFSILFGAQMWMTFISGLVLLFILPRHTFACVQSALFPKYMILNGVTALAVLVSFVQTKRMWSSQENYQITGMIINFSCPLIARVFVVPSLLERIKTKVILERAAGHGPEAGPKLASLTETNLQKCSTYRQTCRRFRQLHAIVAAVNVVTLACNAFHLYYLSSKIVFHH